MSERDLPRRLEEYGANVFLNRIALDEHDVRSGELPSFRADTKRGDTRYDWFVRNYGNECWELDALPPPVLRERVRSEILSYIDQEAWNHCAKVEKAELESLKKFDWKGLSLNKADRRRHGRRLRS